jgi:hypothetical protein
VQPFLVLYYAPLYILRSYTDPQLRQVRRNQREAAAEFLGYSRGAASDGWQAAVAAATLELDSYWVDQDGDSASEGELSNEDDSIS